jgi:hypothetical protein
MLVYVRMSKMHLSSDIRRLLSRVSAVRTRLAMASALCLLLSAPILLTGCNRASAGTPPSVASPQQVDTARQQIDLIPPPSKSRYMAVHSLSTWENPYLTVQENMATLHVTLADANSSDLGTGGMLRPVGARRQDLTVRLSDLPTALNAVPESCWPYGRVVAVEEAHDTPPSARPAVRRNVEAAIKTLTDLGVVVYEWNDGGGLR